MQRKPLVMGNWKCHGRLQANAERLASVAQAVDLASDVDVAVCPATVHLLQAADMLANTPVALGAQNVSMYGDGAYTGEISAEMLADIGARYAIVGHSERRSLFAEDNGTVAAKAKRVLEVGLSPVVCVGETLEQREAGKTLSTVLGQLQALSDKLDDAAAWEKVVLAYEPVWAIGTGQSATAKQAQEVHSAIRNWLRERIGPIAGRVRILYGGSMKPDNAGELLQQEDIDGGLIGGASLDAKSFLAIYHAAKKAAEQ